MSWLALLLIGFGLTDLIFSARPTRIVPECVGAAAAILMGLVAGLTGPADVAAMVLITLAVILWGQTVTRGFAQGGNPWIPLSVFVGSIVVAILAAAQAPVGAGPLQEWLTDSPVSVLNHLDADRALLLLGVLLVQMSTGNVIVRLVLAATGTLRPARHAMPGDPETQLKGGRLLGPLERLFIVGLGLAGHLTAASIVIAAKGLLRFPELQSPRDQAQIHQLTEYFLVGSFVSWMIPLSSLVLLL